MMMKTESGRGRTAVLAAFALILASASGAAGAVERGFYIAADYGKFRLDRSASQWNGSVDNFYECFVFYSIDPQGDYDFDACSPRGDMAIGSSRMGTKSRGYDLWVGYQLSHRFAVEGAFLDMGKSRHAFSGTIDLGDVNTDGLPDGPLPVEGGISFRTRGPAFAGVANLELGEYFSLDARAGFFFADNKLRLNATVDLPDPYGPLQFPYKVSDSKTALFYGASVNYWVTAYTSVRLGYAVYGKGSYDKGPVKHLFVGIRYSYGY